jgi:hypothetical protein
MARKQGRGGWHLHEKFLVVSHVVWYSPGEWLDSRDKNSRRSRASGIVPARARTRPFSTSDLTTAAANAPHHAPGRATRWLRMKRSTPAMPQVPLSVRQAIPSSHNT